MKERPILFSGPMVRAILDGSKTQTRRVVKHSGDMEFDQNDPTYGPFWLPYITGVSEPVKVQCPYGIPGDRLWVRETFTQFPIELNPQPEDFWFKADESRRPPVECKGIYKWRPSIFMPRAASRILLEITDVRVQRLQEISAADIWAEGIAASPDVDPVHEWRELWDTINGAPRVERDDSGNAIAVRDFSWAANPWVWAITFRRMP